jgi:hypothetical protein|tara:strand:+ start:150 stop:1283 length:1134 start_codon:yes stop_codon:yes gene_type:complete
MHRENIENTTVELNSLTKRFNDKSYIVEKIYQRDNEAWSKTQARQHLDDIIKWKPTVSIHLDSRPKRNNTVAIMDGQQRLTWWTKFLNNEFSLGTISDWEGHPIKRKYFEELDREVQEHILTMPIPVVIYKDDIMSDEDMAEKYLSINAGTPLNNAEKRKAMNKAMTETWATILKICPIFNNNLGEPKYISKSPDHEGFRSILDFVYQNFLKETAYVSRDAKSLEKQTLKASKISIDDNVVNRMMDSLNYVAESLEPYTKYTEQGEKEQLKSLRIDTVKTGLLKKNHVRAFTFLHDDLVRRNYDLELVKKEFGNFVIKTVRRNEERFKEWNRNDSGKSQFELHNYLLNGFEPILKGKQERKLKSRIARNKRKASVEV